MPTSSVYGVSAVVRSLHQLAARNTERQFPTAGRHPVSVRHLQLIARTCLPTRLQYPRRQSKKNENLDRSTISWLVNFLGWPFNARIKTAEQRTIIRQYDGRWWVAPAQSPPCAKGRPNSPPVNGASVPTSYYSMWHYNYICTVKG